MSNYLVLGNNWLKDAGEIGSRGEDARHLADSAIEALSADNELLERTMQAIDAFVIAGNLDSRLQLLAITWAAKYNKLLYFWPDGSK